MHSSAESIAREDLEKLQLKRLEETLQRAQRSPFYKEKLGDLKLGESPLDSLARFPFTTKSDLRDHYPDGFLAVEKTKIRRYHASSGTRGKPTLVAYTQNDLDNWAELGARSLVAAGAKPCDVIHNAYGYGPFTGGLGMHAAIERLGATCVPASGGKTQQQITLLRDLRARVLCCTPSYALRISGALEELGMTKDELALEIGIFGAEPWSESMRTRIEAELGLKAVDIYGLSEIMGPGVSIECLEGRDGLHIWEDHFLAEIIDPQSHAPLADGEEGELVFTTLSKEAMPLLRYRTGDLATLNREKCRCGRTMARMTRVRARLDDMLIIRGVNVYPSEIENILLKVDELAPHYQLVLKRESSLDELAVQVEISDELESRWSEVKDDVLKMNDVSQRVQQLMKDYLGLTVSVELLPSRSIARSEGKAARLVDLRAKSDA